MRAEEQSRTIFIAFETELWRLFISHILTEGAVVLLASSYGRDHGQRFISASINSPATFPVATAELGSGAAGHSIALLVGKDFGEHRPEADTKIRQCTMSLASPKSRF